MGNLSINSKNQKKFKLTASAIWIISAGTILAACMIFFIVTLISISGSKSAPAVFNLNQIGATNDSLLISWDCTRNADEYIIKYTGDKGQTGELNSSIPFASIDGLEPNTEYTVKVIPVKDGKLYGALSVQCVTEQYCEITSINIDECTSDSVSISWQYSGPNDGFTAIAYVVDIQGKRHLTSDKIEISAGGDAKCTINGLMPEMNYTVAVMPKSRFGKIGKSTFQTQFKSISYKKFSIIRAVICSKNTQDTAFVKKLTSLKASESYKISMIIAGKAASEQKVNMALYIKNSKGQLVSETKYDDIYTNLNNSDSFSQNTILLDFTSPAVQDEYTAYLTIDGQTVRRIDFDTFDE
ncbi:MAG: fibronectin type III domain-containing protein [Acutalibacteraceae bacterium]